MCYSAQIEQDYRKYVRTYGADIDIKAFVKLFWERQGGSKVKIPKAMEAAFEREAQSDDESQILEAIIGFKADEAQRLEQELFKQTKRLNDAVRALATKTTKKALDDQRIATNKIEQAKSRLADLRRTEIKDRDRRIFPGVYAPVLVVEDGRRVVKPMRYQCRPAGKPAFYDTKFPGTYNARRDNLEGFWGKLFGYSHGLIVADKFYENVEGPDGKNRVLEFSPRTGEPMLIACLWSHWKGKDGEELLSFAAITDDPLPEVAAAGHDRTVLDIKPEYIDTWLNPDPANLAALYAVFDDRQRPYYEHREAA